VPDEIASFDFVAGWGTSWLADVVLGWGWAGQILENGDGRGRWFHGEIGRFCILLPNNLFNGNIGWRGSCSVCVSSTSSYSSGWFFFILLSSCSIRERYGALKVDGDGSIDTRLP
jgi:hypothetical protein